MYLLLYLLLFFILQHQFFFIFSAGKTGHLVIHPSNDPWSTLLLLLSCYEIILFLFIFYVTIHDFVGIYFHGLLVSHFHYYCCYFYYYYCYFYYYCYYYYYYVYCIYYIYIYIYIIFKLIFCCRRRAIIPLRNYDTSRRVHFQSIFCCFCLYCLHRTRHHHHHHLVTLTLGM